MSRRKKRNQQNKSQMQWLIPMIGIVAIALIGAYLLMGTSDDNGGLPSEVSVAEASDLANDGAYVIDVREQWEWDEYHMPGSNLIPLGQLEARLDEIPEDADIVVVCRSGNRSATGREILLDAGFENVTSLEGGLLSWRSQGYPVE